MIRALRRSFALATTIAIAMPGALASDPLSWDFSIGNPGVGYSVLSLAVYDGEIIAGCRSTGQTPEDPLALVQRWDGATWQPLGPPFFGTSRRDVEHLLVHDGDLYIFGMFAIPGHPGASDAARWNGAGWEPMGEGPGGRVYSVTVHDGDIVASGYFGQSFGYTNTRVKRWNGKEWIALGNQFSDTPVLPVLSLNDDLLACNIDFYDGAWVGRVSKWNGTTWIDSGIGNGLPMRPGSIFEIDGELYATHTHLPSGPDDAGIILTMRNGNSWETIAVATPINAGFPIGWRAGGSVVRKYGDQVLLTGAFSSVNGVTARNIVAISKHETLALVETIDFGPGQMIPVGNDLVVGGAFTTINGQIADGVAALTGASATCPGDANADDRVDASDLFQLVNDYTRTGAFLPSDVNSDGVVDFLDINTVLTGFGLDCP